MFEFFFFLSLNKINLLEVMKSLLLLDNFGVKKLHCNTLFELWYENILSIIK